MQVDKKRERNTKVGKEETPVEKGGKRKRERKGQKQPTAMAANASPVGDVLFTCLPTA